MITERDEINIRRTAEKRAHAEGREEGIEIGIERGKLETAKKFKLSGISDEIIATCTGLTLEQVKDL